MLLMAMLGFAMTHIPGIDRSQVLLPPEAVDDYVGPDNPVRFIDAFVDGLDLAAARNSGDSYRFLDPVGFFA